MGALFKKTWRSRRHYIPPTICHRFMIRETFSTNYCFLLQKGKGDDSWQSVILISTWRVINEWRTDAYLIRRTPHIKWGMCVQLFHVPMATSKIGRYYVKLEHPTESSNAQGTNLQKIALKKRLNFVAIKVNKCWLCREKDLSCLRGIVTFFVLLTWYEFWRLFA